MSLICLFVGILVSISVYLLMSPQLSRWLYGMVLFSSVINIIILLVGRTGKPVPPFVNQGMISQMANPLPQALILTAIVISFGLLAFILVLLRNLLVSGHRLQDEKKNGFIGQKEERS